MPITSTLAMTARFVGTETLEPRNVDDSPIFLDCLRTYQHILDAKNEHASFQKRCSHHRVKIGKQSAVLFSTDLSDDRFGRLN